MQADYLHDFLTVKETLHFAAQLKLRHLPSDQRTSRVDCLIKELGLTECQNVLVGGDLKKGLSGGQKKRVR